MQLSLSTFLVIVSLLASIVLPEDEENKIYQSYHKDLRAKMIENSSISRKKRQSSRIRNGRTTYVKAILANPKISPNRQLAEKLARAELKSPKMQETFKKLTAIRAPYASVRKKSPKMDETFKKLTATRSPYASVRKKTGDSKIAPSTYVRSQKFSHVPYSPSRFKGRRKRKRKRHKLRGKKDGSRNAFARRKINNSNFRVIREISNSSNKNGEPDVKDRNEKSIDYNNDESMENLDNTDDNFHDPYGNLNLDANYQEAENTNFLRSGLDENYSTNYLPIGDPSDDTDFSNSIADNNQDFSVPNDPFDTNRYNEKFNDILPENNQNSDWNDNYGISDRERVRNNFEGRRIEVGHKFRRPKVFNGRKNIFRGNNDNFNNFRRNISPLNSKYRLKSVKSIGGQKNPITKEFSEPTNISIISSPYLTTSSPKSSIEHSKTRVQKSDRSIDKTTSVTGVTCTTTEINQNLKRIGDASPVPPETFEKTIDEAKKGMEYRNENLAPEAAIKGFSQFYENDAAAANETKEVAGQILNKIIEELEDIKLDKNKNDYKEGLPCKLSGSWITTQAGVRIDMLVTNRSVNVSMGKLDLPVGIIRQGLLNYTWNITGHAPFKRGGPFSLVATDNHTKTLAAFVGACRVCQGVDTIEGVWSIAREPRDCRDFQMATSIYNDIFRRTKLFAAIKNIQSGITSTSTTLSITKDCVTPGARNISTP